MLTTEKKIRIFHDPNMGISFEMTKVLYENEDVILCNVINESHNIKLTVLIYKDTNEVSSKDLTFYLAENY